MNAIDLVSTAVGNTFRSRTRSILTILAIFVGAFTLTITNGLGTGINRYIDDTVASFGASDVLTVTRAAEEADPLDDGPAEYDPNAISGGFGPAGGTVTALTPDDLENLAGIDGVVDVEATRSISVDYIRHDGGTRYVVGVGSLVVGQSVLLAAGEGPDPVSSESQLTLPLSYVDALGFDDAEAALGERVTLAVTDAERTVHLLDAIVVGIAEETFAVGGASVTPNPTLSDALFDAQNIGVPIAEQERYAQASVWFDPDATTEEVASLQERLADAGYSSTTVAQQLGSLKAIIDAIVLVLNAFAIIALVAAGFGIVNTLLMSVQERTREIGLMKAMGMGSGKIFGLFSLEAIVIGFLGSAIGAGIAILAGTALSSVLSGALLADLPGLSVIAFDPLSITLIILAVMGIAFVAGTLPATRAARADPVESLRYE